MLKGTMVVGPETSNFSNTSPKF